jgi:poly(hydroxyalkanoate) depolymerase family esterase
VSLDIRRRFARLLGWLKWSRVEAASYTNLAGARQYKVYRPWQGFGRRRPLLVMLHGCNQTADDFAAGTRMSQLAARMGCIVVYVEQSAAAHPTRCWNWFKAAHQEREEGEPSLIAGITREVIARHRADPRRVYVAGLSAGGAMAAIMGHTYADLYAAVGIHSGLPYAAARDAMSALAAMRGLRGTLDPRYRPAAFRTIPTIVFHGDLDTAVHSRNSMQAMLQAGPAAHDRGVDAVLKGEENGRRYTRTLHTDASGRVAVEHWLVHGCGHAWSGGRQGGPFVDSRGPDASRAMLKFFLGFTRSTSPLGPRASTAQA